jgi:hypothetical protein
MRIIAKWIFIAMHTLIYEYEIRCGPDPANSPRKCCENSLKIK